MNTLKIMHILPIEEYFSPIDGGALATWVKNVIQPIVDKNVIIIAPKSSHYFDGGFKIISLPVKTFQTVAKKLPKVLSHHLKYNLYVILAALIARFKGYQVVHVHNRPVYISVIRKVYPKAKIILHMQNDHVIYLKEAQLKSSINSCDGIIAVSNYCKEGIIKKIKEFQLKQPFIKTIYNGAIKRDIIVNKNPEVFNVLFVGRFVKEKGILELVKAINAVFEIQPNIRLTIIGGAHFNDKSITPYIQEVYNEANKNPEIFNFVGPIPHHEIVNYYADTHIYTVPSTWNEPLSLTTVEGMACGFPVVASNRGGIPELLENQSGFLIMNPKNPDEIKNAILTLINDPNLREVLGKNAKERFLKNFTWTNIRKNYAVYLDEFLVIN